MEQMKVLISAYACEPYKGSEQGIGWNWVTQISKFHDTWVITRSNNQESIEQINDPQFGNINWIYFDLPKWARFWKRGNRGVQLYYYLWQVGVYFIARKAHKRIHFDLLHHVTLTRYWTPSFASFLNIPFVWGPVGGGESTPSPIFKTFSLRGKLLDLARSFARGIAHIDPFVRKTGIRAVMAVATSEETAVKMKAIGCRNVVIHSNVGLSDSDIKLLSENLANKEDDKLVFISIGRLLHWKGFHLGLMAYQIVSHEIGPSEYWVFGDGHERKKLQKLSMQLGIQDQIRFWGNVPRNELLAKIAEGDVLVHPSLHESGGWVCAEAMANRKPVICLDLGGPGLQVTENTGIKIPAISTKQTIDDIAKAMLKLANNPELRKEMGEAGLQRVRDHFSWTKKAEYIRQLYQEIVM